MDTDKSGDISFNEFWTWLLLLPEVSPRAFFDHFLRSGLIDDQQSPMCHNMAATRGTTASEILAKLCAGALAGLPAKTLAHAYSAAASPSHPLNPPSPAPIPSIVKH